jgi:uncharacterized membrane protein YphA (DoxX/SURF4 family)
LRRAEGNERGVNAAVLVVRLLLGALLVVAGALKVGHAADLASNIANFRLLPAAITGPLAVALPYFELLLGGYLIAGLFTRVAAAIAAAQFVLYAGVIASATADWPHVALDLALAGASGFVAYGAPGALAVDRKLRSAA